MLYYSSKFAKDTNAFWYFCRDIVYVLFHERFSSISTWGNFVTFSLSMTIVSIFKKGSDSLKNLFFFFFFFFFLRLGEMWNIFFVKFSDHLFALNQWDILLRSQVISEKMSSQFMPERSKLVSSTNVTRFSFSEHF